MNAYDDEYESRRIRVLDENGVPHWVEVPMPRLAVAA